MEISINAFCHHFNRMLYFYSKAEKNSSILDVIVGPNVRLGQFANRAAKIVFNGLTDYDKNFILKYLNSVNPRYRFTHAKKSDNTEQDKNATIRITDIRSKKHKNFKYFKDWSFDYLIKYEDGKLMPATIEEVLPTLDV